MNSLTRDNFCPCLEHLGIFSLYLGGSNVRLESGRARCGNGNKQELGMAGFSRSTRPYLAAHHRQAFEARGESPSNPKKINLTLRLGDIDDADRRHQVR